MCVTISVIVKHSTYYHIFPHSYILHPHVVEYGYKLFKHMEHSIFDSIRLLGVYHQEDDIAIGTDDFEL